MTYGTLLLLSTSQYYTDVGLKYTNFTSEKNILLEHLTVWPW